MKDIYLFLSYFFSVTGFNRTDIYSIRHDAIYKRYILIVCLHKLGFNKLEISQIVDKSVRCISEALVKIDKGDLNYAEKIVTEWTEKMCKMPSNITSL